MINEINLEQYRTYAGNLLKCISERTIILQAKADKFENLSAIMEQKIHQSMQEVIEDSVTLEMETLLEYTNGFPHETYWSELRIYIDKYKNQPWQLYNEVRERMGNGLYAGFLLYYAKGVQEDMRTLETWASEVRI